MCDPALHRSSLDVCSSGVSCASTHTDLAPAPTRPSYFEASLTCPKHVRLYLCAYHQCTPEEVRVFRATDSHGKTQYIQDRLVGVPTSFEHTDWYTHVFVKQNENPIYSW
jgi:hypothetical protein